MLENYITDTQPTHYHRREEDLCEGYVQVKFKRKEKKEVIIETGEKLRQSFEKFKAAHGGEIFAEGMRGASSHTTTVESFKSLLEQLSEIRYEGVICFDSDISESEPSVSQYDGKFVAGIK